ncbi:hypothetical protein N2152v2_000939 [Parachlorella kessleri]
MAPSNHGQVFPTASFIPLVGLGTWTQNKPGEVVDAVYTAIKVGYRHLDCAAAYNNEQEVGAGIKRAISEGIVTRPELWVTSKLNNPDHAPEGVDKVCRGSLDRLGLEYLDLYLMHWPLTGNTGPKVDPPLEDTWAAMEKLVHKGLCRTIGVSNFSIKKLEDLMSKSTIRPSVNQVEAHPYFRNEVLLAWCQEQGIHMTCYSPLGTPNTASYFNRQAPEVLKDEKVLKVAKKLGKHPGEVVLRWGVQRGCSVIPKSTSEDHLRSNLAVLDWELSEDDFEALNSLETQCRMLDGNWFLKEEGPYKTLEDLWDRPDEKRTSKGSPGALAKEE